MSFIDAYRPKFFLIENVAEVTSHSAGDFLNKICDVIVGMNYQVELSIYCSFQINFRIFTPTFLIGLTLKFSSLKTFEVITYFDILSNCLELKFSFSDYFLQQCHLVHFLWIEMTFLLQCVFLV